MAFKIAEAYVEIRPDIDRNSFRNDVRRIANEAESAFGGKNTGERIGKQFSQGFLSTLGEGMRNVSSIASGTFGLVFLGAVIALAPIIGAAFTVALLGSLGLGFIALGGLILAGTVKGFADGLKNAIDSMLASLRKAAEPLVVPFKNAAKQIAQAFKDMVPILHNIFAGLAPMIEPLAKAMTAFFTNIFKGVEKALPGINAVLKAISDHLPGLGTAIGDFFAYIGSQAPLLERVTGVLFTWIDSIFKVMGPLLVGLTVIFGALVNTWRSFMIDWNGWISDYSKSKENISGIAKAFGDFYTAVKALWDALVAFASANTDEEITASWNRVKEAAGPVWTAIKEVIKEVWNSLWDDIKRVWDETVEPWLKQAFSTIWDWIAAQVGAKIDQMKADTLAKIQSWIVEIIASVTGLPPGFINAIISLPGQVGNVLNSMKETGMAVVRSFVSGVISSIAQLPGMIASAIAGIPGVVANTFSSAANSGRSGATNVLNAITGVMRGVAGSVASALSNVPGAVSSALSAAIGSATSIGNSISQGVANGIRNGAGAIVAAARTAAANALASAKSYLGIGSPSKLFAKEVGHWIPAGIQQGIERNVQPLNNTIQNIVAPDTQTATRPSVGGPSYNFAPGAIVLDASSLKSVQQLVDLIQSIQSTSRQYRGASVVKA